jgi:hypothetical protein
VGNANLEFSHGNANEIVLRIGIDGGTRIVSLSVAFFGVAFLALHAHANAPEIPFGGPTE